ncbi:MAG TPA: response regulator [Tepidisphaeraceae bacterium]|nr:response regulator [Tepidisphaeraceae bacterium]
MPHTPPTILIVDDSATTRHMIKRVIGMTDLSVGSILEARDGAEGLEIMERSNVDLVLADLNMPKMDGMEMIRWMRRIPKLKTLPIIVISAQPDTLQIDRLKREGIAGYLPKPFTPESVRDLIQPLLDARNSEPEEPSEKPRESFNLTLIEALGEALETMAFISPQLPGDKSDCSWPAGTRLVRVAFHGHGINGLLAIAAPPQLGEMVATNCSSEEEPTEPDDALKELANVTCGLLLRKRIGGGVGFELAPPVIGEPEDMEKLFAGNDVIALDADGCRVCAHVTSDVCLFSGEGAH